MKKRGKNLIALLLSVVLVLSMTACGSDNTETAGGASAQTEAAAAAPAANGEKIVNIGVTDTLGSANPMVIDQTWINKYALGMEFMPLMDLDQDLNFVPMLADSVTTEDNQTFTVHIDDKAVWSDGTPVTAADVEFTVLKIASSAIGNGTLLLYAFEGIDDDGFVPEGTTSVPGIKVVDDKTVQFVSKYPMALTTFQNTYCSYLLTLPKHVLEKYSDAELATSTWFDQPDVVDGPYMITAYDPNHYISYTANEKFWKGTPNIPKLNIQIMDAAQIYAGLQSGEIDVTSHTMTAIPQADYEAIEALQNVDVVYGSAVTNQSVFIQTANLPDARVRQALVYAINRDNLVKNLIGGHGEVVEGFLPSASPFFDSQITPMGYDPEKAKALLQEAGWDESRVLRFYVNSGDDAFVKGAQILVAQWAEVGVKAEVKTVDLAALMALAGSMDYDLFAVQYTYAPVDPYPDVAWLLGGEGSWTGYANDEVNEALTATQNVKSVEEIKNAYSIVDKHMQEDVPMFSAYVQSAQGAVNKRMKNVNVNVYGLFNNVHEWDIAE